MITSNAIREQQSIWQIKKLLSQLDDVVVAMVVLQSKPLSEKWQGNERKSLSGGRNIYCIHFQHYVTQIVKSS